MLVMRLGIRKTNREIKDALAGIIPCGFSGTLGGMSVAEKKARGLCLGETGNEGAFLTGKENSLRVLQAHRYPSLVGASLPPFPSFLALSNVACWDWSFNCPSAYRDVRRCLGGLMTDF